MNENRAGLSPDERGELCALRGADFNEPGLRKRCDELRSMYADNPYAREEIDFNDPSSLYVKKMLAYADALEGSDAEAVDAFEDWFATYYPLHQSGL